MIQTMEKETNVRLEKLELQHKRLRCAFFCLLLIMIVALYVAYKQTQTFGIIRAKGLVIEDASGRDRILIGAPVPFSKSRVRTDTALVRKYWAGKLIPEHPSVYMGYYKDYYHATDGMVIMNEYGFDRVLLGDKLADANTGKRMFEAAGIAWNDRYGFELGGAGVNTTEDGKARGVIGLDNANGEALHLVTLEDGTKALVIKSEKGALMFGMSEKNGQWFQNETEFAGINYFDKEGKLIWSQKMNEKK